MYTYLPILCQRQSCPEEMTSISPSSHLLYSSNSLQSGFLPNFSTWTTLIRLRRHSLMKSREHSSLCLAWSPCWSLPHIWNFLSTWLLWLNGLLILLLFHVIPFKLLLSDPFSSHLINFVWVLPRILSLHSFSSSSTCFPDVWFLSTIMGCIFLMLSNFYWMVGIDFQFCWVLLKSADFSFVGTYLWISFIHFKLFQKLVRTDIKYFLLSSLTLRRRSNFFCFFILTDWNLNISQLYVTSGNCSFYTSLYFFA